MPKPPYLARLLELGSLEAFKQEMRRLEVDKGGIPIMASKGVQRMVLVEGVPTAAANVIKQEILARGGDLVTPWSASGFETPTVDVIFVGTLTTLRSTLSKLYRQHVYDLPLIADSVQKVIVHTTPGYLPVAAKANRQGVVVEETLEDLMGGRVALEPASHRATGRPTLVEVPGHGPWRFGEMTYVMGIVDATPNAFLRMEQVVAEGAHVVDIGGEASESQVVELIRWTRARFPEVLVSVNTSKARAAEQAVAAGAQLIHDVGAMRRDPDMKRVAAATGVPIVLVHSQEGTAYRDLIGDVCRFFYEAMDEAVAAGVREEQIILDVGFGFGKTVPQDLELTRRLRELTSFGRPILHAPSCGRTAGQVPETAAAMTVGIMNGANMVRVHDVLDMARCCQMTDALVRGYAGPDE